MAATKNLRFTSSLPSEKYLRLACPILDFSFCFLVFDLLSLPRVKF